MRFVIHRDRAKGTFWYCVVSRNGQVMLTSETFRRRDGATRAMESLAAAGLKLPLLDLTQANGG